MYNLEDIIRYQMTPLESKAYKIALLWEELSAKEFPNYQHTRLRKKGDPRKSLLFKYCYKLVQETQGIITDGEYRLYVLSQLNILKNMRTTNIHARVDPGILCGEKAWKRWKLWKKLYDQKKKEYDNKIPMAKNVASNSSLESEFKRTYKFLFEKYNKNPSYQQIYQAVHNHTMIRWVTIDRVSPYYILLSPYVGKAVGGKSLDEFFLFKLDVYKESLNSDIKEIFKNIFNYEFLGTS